jgi:glucose/arabinose dehydrogenase
VALLLVVALGFAVYLKWNDLWFLGNLAFPGPTYAAAEDRTTDAAPISDVDVPLPSARVAPQPTGTDPAIALVVVATLDGPSAVADPPGPGRVLITALDGRVHAVDLATGEASTVLDLGGQVSTGGERGLLGIAIDPDATRVYLDYTNGRGDTEIRSWPLQDGVPVGDADDGVLHLKIGQPFSNHNGGNLVFGPDGALWIGTGDGGGVGDRGNVAQNPDRVLGKMLRVVPVPAGGVTAPASNPDWGDRPEVWAIGLRNPWRYSFDRATNLLWIGDVGQNSVEEVSVVDPDESQPNFGWNRVEGSNDYEGEPDPAFVAPVVEYGHDSGVCAVTGGYVYRGAAIPSLYGWYLFGDYCAGWIRAVPADEPGSAPVELIASAGSVTSFGEMEDGELLVLTGDAVLAVLAAS